MLLFEKKEAKKEECEREYAFRKPPALRAAQFEPQDIGNEKYGRTFLSRNC